MLRRKSRQPDSRFRQTQGNDRKCIDKPVGMRSIFALLCNVVLVKAAFLRKLFDQFVIITGDSQLFAQKSADGSSAASELAADGNDTISHNSAFLPCRRCKPPAILWVSYHNPHEMSSDFCDIWRLLHEWKLFLGQGA